ncbi:MAG: hypothetical protein HN849_33035 [Victivallales bacterium]|jgi:hypothetical protein|nr:hypothetical protein [Victivallales bacterium]MBT7304407.1 hypothetical protein [Victivallales bacterium]
MRKRAATLICAAVFALFHVIVVAMPVILSGGGGEKQAFAVIYFDLPLVVALELIPGGEKLLGGNLTAYVAFVSVVGTLMYACCGALIGYAVDRVRVRLSRPRAIADHPAETRQPLP